MQTSIYLAKLIGPVLALAGAGFLLNRAAFARFANDFVGNPGFIMMSGFPALVIGLAIVNAHNIWVADWPVIITVLGWAAVASGILRVTMPDMLRDVGRSLLNASWFIVAEAVLLIGLGGWLSYAGYIAS